MEAEGNETNMHAKLTLMMTIVVMFAFSQSGCYTKLMTPQEFVHTQRYQPKKNFTDNSYSINYNQSCVTCHSVTELNERTEDLEYYGVRTVHDGITLSSRLWIDGSVLQPSILVPSPSPYWPSPYDPVTPWWTPLGTTVTTTTNLPSGDGNRIRNGGSTRDENKEGERNAPISSPTYTQPQAPVGGTTPVPSTPAPAVQVAPSTPPAQTNDSGRTRESNENTNSSNRTRSDGATRDDNGNRPR